MRRGDPREGPRGGQRGARERRKRRRSWTAAPRRKAARTPQEAWKKTPRRSPVRTAKAPSRRRVRRRGRQARATPGEGARPGHHRGGHREVREARSLAEGHRPRRRTAGAAARGEVKLRTRPRQAARGVTEEVGKRRDGRRRAGCQWLVASPRRDGSRAVPIGEGRPRRRVRNSKEAARVNAQRTVVERAFEDAAEERRMAARLPRG